MSSANREVMEKLSISESSVDVKMDAIEEFSELPEPIIHLIMSFLPTKYAARMSAVSKKFRSAWLSFPIFNFDIRAFHQSEDIMDLTIEQKELFMVFVYNSLQRREPKTSIQKLSYRSVLTGFNSNDHLDWVINYALHNNVQELDLDGYSERRRFNRNARFCSLPKALFLAKSVRVLKVGRFNLEPQDLILSCPLLEDFRVRRCVGMKSIRVSSTLLKAAEVGQCSGLQRIDIDAPNLESFSYNGDHDKRAQPYCDIDVTSCKSLRNLTLKLANITDQFWLKDNLPKFPCLENLKLADCPRLKDISCVCLASIKEIELDNCVGLEKIEIDGPNLQSFLYRIIKSKPCEINISACKCLRKLALDGADISNRWIKDNMSAFSLLESLKLSHCQLLEKIKFRHKLLKSLKLIQCTNLVKAEIDTPKLLSFVFDGKFNISPPVITSSHWDAKLKLRNNDFSDKWFTYLSDFLVGFDKYCRVLTLVCSYSEQLKFQEELRKNMLPPLYDFRHVKIKLDKKPENLMQLVESLVWLVPLPETISFVWGKKERSLKFQYHESMGDRENLFCCWLRPKKCWSHRLKSVAMDNFEDDVCTENVKEFFIKNAILLDTIYENSKGFRIVYGKLVEILNIDVCDPNCLQENIF